MFSVNQIVRQYGADYLEKYGASMLPSHLQAMEAISYCRTEMMGFHSQVCEDCGYQHRVYHSCKNRSCPQCFFKRTQTWLEVQETRLLPVHYFHVIFTLPSQLREIMRSHQKQLYPVLFRAAADSLQALAKDDHYLGGQLGILAVLHTWSGAMVYHPHVHCLIPGCGMTPTGKVVLSRKNYLINVQALSAKFRGRFLALARKAVPEVDFSVGGNVKQWVVFSKGVETQNRERVLRYLARYLHRMAISNANIIQMEKGKVVFHYKQVTDKQGKSTWAIMKLDPMEFLRRFLQHVLPKGMAKVRYYGFLAPSNRAKLAQIRRQLLLLAYLKNQTIPRVSKPAASDYLPPCPECGGSHWKSPWSFKKASKMKEKGDQVPDEIEQKQGRMPP